MVYRGDRDTMTYNGQEYSGIQSKLRNNGEQSRDAAVYRADRGT